MEQMTKDEAEKIYDEEISPKLLALGKRCQELGFPFIAQVEFDKGYGGRERTDFCPPTAGDTRPSAAQLLVHYAARCNGNVDSLINAIKRDSETYGHNSAYLTILWQK